VWRNPMQSRRLPINRGVASASSGANSWGVSPTFAPGQRDPQYRWASRTRCRRRFTSSRSFCSTANNGFGRGCPWEPATTGMNPVELPHPGPVAGGDGVADAGVEPGPATPSRRSGRRCRWGCRAGRWRPPAPRTTPPSYTRSHTWFKRYPLLTTGFGSHRAAAEPGSRAAAGPGSEPLTPAHPTVRPPTIRQAPAPGRGLPAMVNGGT
jgi:hypothetical protein